MLKGLLKKLRKRDEDAERVIFDMFYQRVYQAAYYIVQDADMAQDIVQDTFMKGFDNMHTVKDGEKLGAWLAAIASRTAIDYVRKRNRWNKIVADDVLLDDGTYKDENEPPVETAVEEKFLKKLILQELDGLKPEYKQVLLLRYVHDLSYEEVADTLDLNLSTVKSRTHRAKRKLREAIESKPGLREMIFNAES